MTPEDYERQEKKALESTNRQLKQLSDDCEPDNNNVTLFTMYFIAAIVWSQVIREFNIAFG